MRGLMLEFDLFSVAQDQQDYDGVNVIDIAVNQDLKFENSKR